MAPVAKFSEPTEVPKDGTVQGQEAEGSSWSGARDAESSTGEETFEGLMGKLRDLHEQIRVRHGQNLKRINSEVFFAQSP